MDKRLMRVRVTMGETQVDEDIAALAAITPDSVRVQAALAEQVGMIAWWLTLETYAERQEREAQDALDALEAGLLLDAQGSNVTEKRAWVRAQSSWGVLHSALRKAQDQKAMVRVGRKTAEERKDVLKELSQNMRAEMFSGIERGGVRQTTSSDAAADAAVQRVRSQIIGKRGGA